MPSSLLTKFLSGLLVIALWSATITFVTNQTLLSSHYLEGQLDTTHSYDRLSVALTQEITKQPDLAANPQVAAALQPILTPAVLKTKINSALDQIQGYYRGNGPQPTIDLTDLAAQAQAAGIPIGADSGLTKPIVIGSTDSTKSKAAGKAFDHARLASIIAVVVLAAGLLALSFMQRRFTALPTVLIIVGALIGLLAVCLHFAPGVADHFIKFNATSNAFVALGHDLTGSIARDQAKRFGIIAAIYLAVGIGTRILVARLQPTQTVKK